MNFDDELSALQNSAKLKLNQIMEKQLCSPELTELSQEEISMVVAGSYGAFYFYCGVGKLKDLENDALLPVFISHLAYILNLSPVEAIEQIKIVQKSPEDETHMLQQFMESGVYAAEYPTEKDWLCDLILKQRKIK